MAKSERKAANCAFHANSRALRCVCCVRKKMVEIFTEKDIHFRVFAVIAEGFLIEKGGGGGGNKPLP